MWEPWQLRETAIIIAVTIVIAVASIIIAVIIGIIGVIGGGVVGGLKLAAQLLVITWARVSKSI